MAWSALTMQQALPSTYRAPEFALRSHGVCGAPRSLRSREGQAGAILVANVLERDRQDIRREPLEDRTLRGCYRLEGQGSSGRRERS